MKKYVFVSAYADDSLTAIDISNPLSPSYAGRISGAGSPNYLDRCYGVVYRKGIAFVHSLADNSLVIVNVKKPETPSLLSVIRGAGSPNYLGRPYHITVVGNYCYVASENDNGLTIIDISDLTNPAYAGGIYGAGSPNYLGSTRGIAVSGKYAYVVGWAGADKSFTVIDISAKSNPKIVGQLRSNIYFIAHTCRYLSNKVYVLKNSNFTIVDVNDPTNPTILGSTADWDTSPFTTAVDMVIRGNYLYAADWSKDGLFIFDISDPSSDGIRQVGSITGAGSPNYLDGAWGVDVHEKYAYIGAEDEHALTVIDISDPTNPTFVGSIRGSGSPNYLGSPIGSVAVNPGLYMGNINIDQLIYQHVERMERFR